MPQIQRNAEKRKEMCSNAQRGAHVEIEVPLPPRACHPNARVHWSVRAAANAQMRNWAYYRVKKQHMAPLRWRAAHITVQAHYSDNRRRDNDSLLASLKSAIDGIVDSGLLVDDDQVTYTVLPAARDREKGQEGVTLTIEEET